MPVTGVLGGQGRSPVDPFNNDPESFVGLRAFVAYARDSIEMVDFATVMIASPGSVHVVGDAHVREIEAVQCADRDGPAFEALRTRRVCRIVSAASSPCWPALRDVCRRHGVMSVASAPIFANGVAEATLNLYSRDYHAFGAAETRAALRLAEQASQLIAEARSSAGTSTEHQYDSV